VARLPNVFGAAADSLERPVGAAHAGELSGDRHSIATIGDGAAEELFVGERPVHVRCIEERDTELDGAMDRSDRLRVVTARIELGHTHASESERGDTKSLRSESALLHCTL